MCKETNGLNGLSKQRTIRLCGIGILVAGIFLVALGCVLSYAGDFASETVRMGMARYENFTGKIALSSFAEDKLLMQKLLFAKETLLPVLSVSVPVSVLLGVLGILLSGACFLFPVRVAELLLKCRILKECSPDENAGEPLKISPKILCGTAASLCAVVLAVILIFACDPSQKTAEKVSELRKEAARFYVLERDYFNKTKKVGTWKEIGYEPSASDYFMFKTSGAGRWTAENREALENCPGESLWNLSFEVKGFFSKELKLYARAPKDSACARLTQNFRKEVLELVRLAEASQGNL